MITFSEEELNALPRKELQKIAKENRLKANKKSTDLIVELLELFNATSVRYSVNDLPFSSPNDNNISESCHIEEIISSSNEIQWAHVEIQNELDIPEVDTTERVSPCEIKDFMSFVKVGDELEALVDGQWLGGSVKKINKKSLRIFIAKLEKQITVSFTSVREVGKLADQENDASSHELEVEIREHSVTEDEPQRQSYGERTPIAPISSSFSETVDSFMHEFESKVTIDIADHTLTSKPVSPRKSSTNQLPNSPVTQATKTVGTPVSLRKPSVLPKSNRTNDLRMSSAKKRMSSIRVGARIFQDPSVTRNVMFETKKLPKQGVRISRRLSFTLANTGKEKKEKTVSEGRRDTAYSVLQKCSTAEFEAVDKDKVVESLTAPVKKLPSQVLKKSLSNVFRKSGGPTLHSSSAAASTAKPVGVGARISYLPRSTPSSVAVSGTASASNRSGLSAVATRINAETSFQGSHEKSSYVLFKATAKKAGPLRNSTLSAGKMVPSTVSAAVTVPSRVSELTDIPVGSVTTREKGKGRGKCPDFNKLHAKNFNKQKALTDIVRRNELIGEKMGVALAAANKRPHPDSVVDAEEDGEFGTENHDCNVAKRCKRDVVKPAPIPESGSCELMLGPQNVNGACSVKGQGQGVLKKDEVRRRTTSHKSVTDIYKRQSKAHLNVRTDRALTQKQELEKRVSSFMTRVDKSRQSAFINVRKI